MATENLETLKTELGQFANSANFTATTTKVGDDVLEIPRESLVQVLQFIKDTGRFDMLMDLCGVDYPERVASGGKRFEVVYGLFSTRRFNRLRIKVQVNEGETVPSAVGVFKNANWYEREAYRHVRNRVLGSPKLDSHSDSPRVCWSSAAQRLRC